MKLRLVANWRAAWKWWSMRFAAAAVAAQGAWMTIPQDVLLEFISDMTQRKITAGLVLAAIVGRLIDQGTATPQEQQE